jgi:hypothetical protein
MAASESAEANTQPCRKNEAKHGRRELTLLRAAALTIPPIGLKPPREQQYDNDNQDDANYTDTAMTIAVAVTPETAAEAAQQKDDEENNEYEPKRHDLSPVANPTLGGNRGTFHVCMTLPPFRMFNTGQALRLARRAATDNNGDDSGHGTLRDQKLLSGSE